MAILGEPFLQLWKEEKQKETNGRTLRRILCECFELPENKCGAVVIGIFSYVCARRFPAFQEIFALRAIEDKTVQIIGAVRVGTLLVAEHQKSIDRAINV